MCVSIAQLLAARPELRPVMHQVLAQCKFSLSNQLSLSEWAAVWLALESNGITRAALAHLLLPACFAQVFSAAAVVSVAALPAGTSKQYICTSAVEVRSLAITYETTNTSSSSNSSVDVVLCTVLLLVV
jgi:hypothetical protein